MNHDYGHVLPLQTTTSQSKKRKKLTSAEKGRICQFHYDNPLVTHSSIAAIFDVERSTVSKIVRQSHHADQVAPEEYSVNREPEVTARSPELSSTADNQLLEWIYAARVNGINVTRDMIRAQAAIFACTPLCQLPPLPSSTSYPQPPTSISIVRPVVESLPCPLSLGSDTFAESYIPGFGPDLLYSPCHNLTATTDQNYSHTILPPGILQSSGGKGQHEFFYDTLAPSSMYNPARNVDATPSCPQLRGKDTCASAPYADILATRVGLVRSVDARSAFGVVETYLLNSPAMTALDSLCLSHVKACLDRL